MSTFPVRAGSPRPEIMARNRSGRAASRVNSWRVRSGSTASSGLGTSGLGKHRVADTDTGILFRFKSGKYVFIQCTYIFIQCVLIRNIYKCAVCIQIELIHAYI